MRNDASRRADTFRRCVAVTTITAMTAGACSASDTQPQSEETPSTSTGPTIASTTAPSIPTAAPTPAPTSLASSDWRDTVDATCERLELDGFETRKAALEAYEALAEQSSESAIATAELASSCGDSAERLAAAMAVQERRDRLDSETSPVTISDLECADGAYQFVATNEVDHPIGVHVGFRLFVGDDNEPAGSADYPIVIWELDAGASQGITGEFHEPQTDAGYRCNLIARVFDATDGSADASTPGRSDPSLTGDDPAEWFGALLGREVDSVGSGDPDAAAVTEDIRSTFYDNVLAANVGSEPVDRVPSSVKICSGTVDQPGDDRLSFVYFVTYPTQDGSEGLLRHGLFRRGEDDQWRWLSAAHYFDSPDFWSCGKPGPLE